MRRKKQGRVHTSDLGAAVFLANPPTEIRLLLKCFQAGARSEECSKELKEFACGFLGALVQDQALIPLMNVHPAKLLAWVLTHHLRNPEHCGAWLNLGCSLRLMAASDPEPVASTRLQKALECFNRSLALGHSERSYLQDALALATAKTQRNPGLGSV